MNYKDLNGITIREGFEKFHSDNPHVYRAFESQALKAIDRGRKKLSAKLIINWIRWNEFMRTSDQNFRINDAYQSYYAREFIKQHPKHDHVFELRKLRNEEPGKYMEVDADGQLSFLGGLSSTDQCVCEIYIPNPNSTAPICQTCGLSRELF